MKLSVTLAVVLLGLIALYALRKENGTSENVKKPIEYATLIKTSTHVGAVKPIQISLENKSDEIVIIENISTTCGCIAPSLSHIRIDPGKIGFIPLIFRDVGGEGIRDYHVIAKTNIKNQEYIKVKIAIEIYDEIKVVWDNPVVAYKGKDNGDDLLSFQCWAHNGQEQIQEFSIKSDYSWIKIESTLVNNEIRGKVKLLDNTPNGYSDVSMEITMQINGKEYRRTSDFTTFRKAGLATKRPFSIGRYSAKENEAYVMPITIDGGDLHKYNICYTGSGMFESFVEVKSSNLVVIHFKPLQAEHGFVEKGGLFVRDGDVLLMSHPVYLKY